MRKYQVLKFFKISVGPNIKDLDHPGLNTLTIFLIISFVFFGGLSTDSKGEKVILFGFGTGSKVEKLNLYSSEYSSTRTNSEKYHFDEEKNSRKFSTKYGYLFKNLIF
jgi:hypothetical protein